ncbi:MAG: hypothetical protein JKX80_01050 [Candidatus Pacebacteria bacterium]|nr:hypothetical protein [Candidatus Paceibacterota bacterium]
MEIYKEGNATSISSAARKAVIGSGISYGPEVEGITREICSELGRRGASVRRKKAQNKKKRVAAKVRYEKNLGLTLVSEESIVSRVDKPAHYEPKQLILL